jgi:hypothetical protein
MQTEGIRQATEERGEKVGFDSKNLPPFHPETLRYCIERSITLLLIMHLELLFLKYEVVAILVEKWLSRVYFGGI